MYLPIRDTKVVENVLNTDLSTLNEFESTMVVLTANITFVVFLILISTMFYTVFRRLFRFIFRF